MMTQGTLPFQYQIEKSESGLTAFAGLPLYIEMAMATGLCKKVEETLQTKSRGWKDQQMIMSLILLNIAGGDCVDDIERLESDPGLRKLLLKAETHGMKRKARREYEKRWRKSKGRALPSAAAIHRFLEQFHHCSEEERRVPNTAFIPANNASLDALMGINSVLIEFAQQKNPCKTATLDQDATLSATSKDKALFCYQNFKAYQPFNTYWAEQGLLVHSEFRDGNVNAGFEQLRLLKESLSQLPQGVENVFLRSDSAGYQHDLLKYCAEGQDERFGLIEFAIAAKVSAAFKAAVCEVKKENWYPIYKKEANGVSIKTNQEWAEVCFVPGFAAKSKKTPNYRYLAIRERMATQVDMNWDGAKPVQKELPFQTLPMDEVEYKLFGIVTNRTMDGNDLIHWHRERCGHSEKVHSMEKTDLAGGQFPSNKFGANAAWWQIMVLAFNLNQLMKTLVMPQELSKKRLKGLRFHVIHVAGRLTQHARGLSIKLSGGEETLERFSRMRDKIMMLGQSPPAMQLT